MKYTAEQAAENYTDTHGGIAYHNEQLGVSVVIDRYNRVHEFGSNSHMILTGDHWEDAGDDDNNDDD